MKNKRLSQTEICFLLLYQSKKEYMAAHEFVGYSHIDATNSLPFTPVYMSYKNPVRLSDLYYNPDLNVQRRKVTGVTGAKYYEYKLVVKDPSKLPERFRKLI